MKCVLIFGDKQHVKLIMARMKRKFLLSIALLAGLSVFAADGLRVTPRSGESVVFLFDQEPEISFVADRLQISSNDSSEPFAIDLDDVESVTFENGLSVVSLEEADGMFFTSDAEGVHFRNVPEGASVLVCDMTGRVLLNSHAGNSGVFDLLRSEYGGSMLVVKVGTLTAKIAL